MEERIKNYIESVFRGVPQTEHSESIKNEILQNLLDKYHDLKNEGRNDEEAYAIAISSGGDLSDIVADLKSGSTSAEKIHQKIQQNAGQGHYNTRKLTKRERKKIELLNSVLWPITIFVYFFYSILVDGAWSYSWIIFLITPSIESFYKYTVIKSNEKIKNRALSSCLWTSVTAFYFIISFITHRWGITWLIFIFGIAVSNIIKAALSKDDYDDEDEDDKYGDN